MNMVVCIVYRITQTCQVGIARDSDALILTQHFFNLKFPLQVNYLHNHQDPFPIAASTQKQHSPSIAADFIRNISSLEKAM